MTDKLPSWSLGIGFVLIIGMFPAIVIIALLTELSESQLDIFNTATGVIAVVIGAGFGVTVQAGRVRSAEGDRDRAQAERETAREEKRTAIEAARVEKDAAIEKERKEKDEAAANAAERERERGEARRAETKAKVLGAAARWQNAPNLQLVKADDVRPRTLIQQARESPDAFYVMDTPGDLPTGLDSAAFMEEIAEAFDDPET